MNYFNALILAVRTVDVRAYRRRIMTFRPCSKRLWRWTLGADWGDSAGGKNRRAVEFKGDERFPLTSTKDLGVQSYCKMPSARAAVDG